MLPIGDEETLDLVASAILAGTMPSPQWFEKLEPEALLWQAPEGIRFEPLADGTAKLSKIED